MDSLGRGQFLRLVRRGDAAWKKGEREAALSAWREALGTLQAEPSQALGDRLHAAAVAVCLPRGRELSEAGDHRGALSSFRSGLELAPADRELKAAEKESAQVVADQDAVEEGLKKARVLAFSPEKRGEAIELLKSLKDAAARIGATARLEAELRRIEAQ